MMHIARPPQCLAAPSAALSSRRVPHTEAPWAGHTVGAQPCERLSAGLACSSHQRLPLRRRTRRVEVIAHAHERVASAGVAERTSSVESLDSEALGLHRSSFRAAKATPLYVMLPLDTVSVLNKLNHVQALTAGMRALRAVGVDGVTVDVWWGVVESRGPRRYDFSAYKQLVQMVAACGLKLQVVLSFHACGCNVGDCCTISLPPWVLSTAAENPDVFFTDASARRADEYLSFAVDELPLFQGRSPVEMYADFMAAFRDEFSPYLGPDNVIPVVCVSLGPAGELRYPAYPEGKWRFPGIGEFQCYDKYSLASLRAAALAVDQPQWGLAGPHDAGTYNSRPHDTPFFTAAGRWASPYGHFFLSWYSDALIAHGDRLLGAAASEFSGTGATIAGKLPGIHWWFKTRSRAAEATAGIYASGGRDAYGDLVQLFARHGALLDFTCAEMRDGDLPSDAACGPEALLARVRSAAAARGVPLAAENALPRFDARAHAQILRNATYDGLDGQQLPPLASFTYLRMSERLFHPQNWGNFVNFVRSMTYCGDEAALDDNDAAVRWGR